MRFDTPIYFQRFVRGSYNPATGDYAADSVVETEMYADITETGADTIRMIYGSLKEDSKTVRIQGSYDSEFDRIRIGTKSYKVDRVRELVNKTAFIVSEVM